MKKYVVAVIAALGLISVAHADNSQVKDFSSLVRMVQSPTNPAVGYIRVITPVLYVSNDANSFPKYFSLYFNVFDPTGSSKTPLFQTTTDYFQLPAMPCANPIPGWSFTYNPNFYGHWGSKREFAVIDFSIGCNESSDGSYHQADLTYVYGADVTQPGVSNPNNAGTLMWSAAYPNPLIAASSLDLVNGNTSPPTLGVQDGQDDTIMLVMKSGNNAIRMVLLNNVYGGPYVNPAWKMPPDRTFNIGQPY